MSAVRSSAMVITCGGDAASRFAGVSEFGWRSIARVVIVTQKFGLLIFVGFVRHAGRNRSGAIKEI
jgi:hypothetical protein